MRLAPLSAIVLLAACTPDDLPDPGNATFRCRASVEQVHVWKAVPGAEIRLERNGVVVASGVADEQGSLVFRKVLPGTGYVVRAGTEHSRALEIVSAADSAPPPGLYAQKLVKGFQYLEMRDGTKLSAYVTFPAGDGPYPTVLDYSGYNPSEPGRPLGSYESLCPDVPALCDAPRADASLFMALQGYATVNVNLRGTGCSGGAYDYFEPLQILDGYDVVQLAAAQDWVARHKVGMVGLSYPGITQLFVARSQPPGLAAISPLSVIGNTATTLVPGGILNDGFAISWVTHVLDRARPYGQGWERARVDAGDTVCEENQLLHSQRVDNVEQARHTPFYVPEIVDPLNPEKWVDRITVPVFIAGAWQDEQTGPFFASLLDRFRSAPALRMYVHNGFHPDQYAPAIFYEWKAFLDLFVAGQVPKVPPLVRAMASNLFQEVFGAGMELPSERFGAYSTHAEALAAWKAEPRLHVLFESGVGGTPGAPVAAFEKTFAAWPPPHTARRWFLQPDGTLGDAAPAAASAASDFERDPQAGARGMLAPGSGAGDLSPTWDWRQPQPDRAVVFESAPLDRDLAMTGTGSFDLFVRSTAAEADLQVNLSEIRPDGKEMYVQSGWLRASQRKLSGDATELSPEATHLEADVQPLMPGEWTRARVMLAPFGHVFRAGSRLRAWVDTPGGARTDWRFALASVPAGTRIAVGHDASHPSSIALPVLDGVTADATLPACTVRAQPCRDRVAFANTAAGP